MTEPLPGQGKCQCGRGSCPVCLLHERNEARAEVQRLTDALLEARRRLNRYHDKGPKQVARALIGIENTLGIDWEEPTDAPR